MNAISMNSENSKTFSLHSLLLNLADKMNLRRGNIHVALSYLSIFYTLKNIKKSYGNSKFKRQSTTLVDQFELFDGSYSVSDVQKYFEYIIEKNGTLVHKPPEQIYVNKTENRITFKIKTG